MPHLYPRPASRPRKVQLRSPSKTLSRIFRYRPGADHPDSIAGAARERRLQREAWTLVPEGAPRYLRARDAPFELVEDYLLTHVGLNWRRRLR
jgi:hypothetical protein